MWEVLADNDGVNSMNVTAIDTVEDGFNLSLEAMDTLTNGHAKEFGVVSAQATEAMDTLTNGHAKEFGVVSAQATRVSKSYCGL